MTLQYLHRMHLPASFPAEAATRAPDILATWMRYAPDSAPTERDFEDWAENAIMLHEADRVSSGEVRLLSAERNYRLSGDPTISVPAQPGAPRAFMYGMWRTSDSIDFPRDVDMVGNNAAAVRRVSAYASSPVFLAASQRAFHVVDADRSKIEHALQELHAAGHRKVFIKTRFKEAAQMFTLPEEPIDLWGAISRDSVFEWFLIQHEGATNILYIQEAFEPTKEYRMIVVGDKVATGAGCIEDFTPLNNAGEVFDPRVETIRNHSKVIEDPSTVARYSAFAHAFAQEWAAEHGADMIYSLDLAVDARTGDIVVIELNPMTNLGLYACNAERLVDTINGHFEP